MAPEPLQLFGSLSGARLTLVVDGRREVLDFDVNGRVASRAARTAGAEGRGPDSDATLFDAAVELAQAHLRCYQPDHPGAKMTAEEFEECMVPPGEMRRVHDFDAPEAEGGPDPLG